jgi:hypothetical protein
MSEVTVTRVPQPVAHGTPYQKTIVYQIHNLAAALPLIAEDDTIVLKWRPDFAANVDFLRDKIESFDLDCEIESDPAPFGVQMPSRSSTARSGRHGPIQISRSSTKMLRSWDGRMISPSSPSR